jgi:hypothetical protein
MGIVISLTEEISGKSSDSITVSTVCINKAISFSGNKDATKLVKELSTELRHIK